MKLNGIVIAGVIIAVFVGSIMYKNSRPGEVDGFAQCITDSGAKMYGAFWCPHCLKQKSEFGKSWKLIDYIECSTPQKTQNKVCKDANIQGYPTWEFSDGSRLSGHVPHQTLSERTGCAIDGQEEEIVVESGSVEEVVANSGTGEVTEVVVEEDTE